MVPPYPIRSTTGQAGQADLTDLTDLLIRCAHQVLLLTDYAYLKVSL